MVLYHDVRHPRHHVGEVLLTCTFESLKVEASKSPEVTIFQRFKNNWENLELENFRSIDMDYYNAEEKEFLNMCIRDTKDIIETTERCCTPCDDYLEFINLSKVFLQLNDKNKDIKLRKPGAIHKVRWMAKMIYSLKMCILQDQISLLPIGSILTRDNLNKYMNFQYLFPVSISSGGLHVRMPLMQHGMISALTK